MNFDRFGENVYHLKKSQPERKKEKKEAGIFQPDMFLLLQLFFSVCTYYLVFFMFDWQCFTEIGRMRWQWFENNVHQE